MTINQISSGTNTERMLHVGKAKQYLMSEHSEQV